MVTELLLPEPIGIEPSGAGNEGWRIAADELHVWIIDIAGPEFEAIRSEDHLDPREAGRAGQLRDKLDREAYERVHVALRQILGGYLDSPPGRVVFQYDCIVCGRRHGKPTVATPSGPGDTGLCFNMARSGTTGVVGLTRSSQIGVDVERLDREIESLEVLEFFAPLERAALADTDPERRLRDCLVTWTRKEAYTKALGIGLSLGLDEFEVSVPPDPPVLRRPAPEDEAEWVMAELALVGPYVGTVVVDGGLQRARVFGWNKALGAKL